ncbi:hypothetical protein [Hymenobacter metallilatus]|uniref:Uncharacterized protein n=1 Tax=Hymenobacter metallilatus TaxID=2493666 RepID=A0A3R9M0V0_9BACT|nr:hypothetical protein [Hymenobacter metallilatus]RSK33128.1 hypothetical protein EI290_10455 [Hymenobacter metallilatus]
MSTAISACSTLSRQHRAWIALYSLQMATSHRNQVLAQNNVTESDLVEYQESWVKMQVRRGMLEK